MDISDFLNAGASDLAAQHTLARNVQQHAPQGIPDQSGGSSFSSQDAANDYQDEAQADTQGTFDSTQMGGDQSESDQSESDQSYARGGVVKAYDDGGATDDDGDDGDEQLDRGAIPEPEGRQGQSLPEQAGINDVGMVNTDADGDGDGDEEDHQPTKDNSWRDNALQAVDDGLEYGRSLHGVNRPVDDDGTKDNDVRGYLQGVGAIAPDQFQAALQQVDPHQELSEGDRRLKAIGALYKFYGDNDPQQAAAAAWGGVQHMRREYGAYAAAATAADDHGKGERAADLATKALNSVPDGTDATVEFTGAGKPKDTQRRLEELADKTDPWALMRGAGDAVMSGIGKVRDMVGGDKAKSIRDQQPQISAPDTQPASDGSDTPMPRPRPAASTDNALTNSNGKRVSIAPGRTDGGMYRTTVTDPETGKELSHEDLTPEQLKHLMAEHHDVLGDRGLTESVRRAAQVQPGQERHLAGAGRPAKWWEQGYRPGSVMPGGAVRDQDGMVRSGFTPAARPAQPAQPQGPKTPPGITVTEGDQSHFVPMGNQPPIPGVSFDGLTPGDQYRLRQAYSQGQVDPKLTASQGQNQSRENVARITAQGRLDQENARQTGLNGRGFNAPGQELSNIRSAASHAAADTKDWLAQQRTRPSQDAIDLWTDQRNQLWRERLRRQQQQQQPQQQQQQPQPQQQQQQQQPQQRPQRKDGDLETMNGKQYRYDAAHHGWTPL